MATNVNPPPFLRVPTQFLGNRELRAFFEQQNTILFQLWQRTGGDTDDLSELIALVNQLIAEVGVLTLEVDNNRNLIDANTQSIIDNSLAIADNAGEININSGNITTNTNNISTNTGDITALKGKELTIKRVSVDYIAEPYQVIICDNTPPIAITLNTSPVINELVHIKRTDGVVNIIGTIDGLVDLTLNVIGYSVLLIFNGTDWSQI